MKITLNNLQDVYKSPRCSVETMELRGYELVTELFVDNSGLGAEDEPALTASQFENRLGELINNHGSLYSTITNVGQFQVYVGLFVKTGKSKTKKLGNNTWGIYDDGELVAVRLHDTNVIEWDHDYIVLNSGGWHTNTTKERINRYLPAGVVLYQRDYEWFVRDDRDRSIKPFEDGMRIAN